ncbi:MAG: hypothetical protein AAF316_00570 [Cyanobacteria bacterium P01_A01_bin.80]
MEPVNLNDDDVVSVNEDLNPACGSTSKICEIRKEVLERFADYYPEWEKGCVKGEALVAQRGGGWIKGKLKMKVSVSFEIEPMDAGSIRGKLPNAEIE